MSDCKTDGLAVGDKEWLWERLMGWQWEMGCLERWSDCGKLINPSTDCVSPIGAELFEKGLRKEVNAEGELVVSLDTEITEDLRLEWLARDIIRQVAEMRKEAWYDVTDRIYLEISDDKVVERFWDLINQETLSEFGKIENADLEGEVEGVKIRILKR